MRYWVFAACALACAVGHLAIIASVSRRSPAPTEPGVPRPRRAVEILWALLPAVALALVLTATWDKVSKRAEPPVIMKVAR